MGIQTCQETNMKSIPLYISGGIMEQCSLCLSLIRTVTVLQKQWKGIFCFDNYLVTSSISELLLFNSKNWVTQMLPCLTADHTPRTRHWNDWLSQMITAFSSSLFRHRVCVCLYLWMFSASAANWFLRLADARSLQPASHCCTICLFPSFHRIHNWTACMKGKEGKHI